MDFELDPLRTNHGIPPIDFSPAVINRRTNQP